MGHKIVLMLFSFFTVACGIDESARFPNKIVGAGDKAPVHAGSSQTADVTIPAESSESTETNPDGEESEEPRVDPQSLVLSGFYRGYFQLDSMLRLSDGHAPSSNFSVASTIVKQRLQGGSSEDGITASQTFGDGVQYAEGRQLIKNRVGDREASSAEGGPKPSESGVQTYRRVTGGDCPSTLICVDEIRFVPDSGEAVTICFKDPSTGTSRAIPFAIAPNYSATDYELFTNRQIYGPFLAEKYRGHSHDCHSAGEAFILKESFSVSVAKGQNLVAQRYATHSEAKPNLELVMQVTRSAADNKAPYLDETIRLQYQTRFLLNTDKRSLVKMVKSVRKSAKMPLILDVLLPMDGIQVDLHLELCKDLLQNVSYCAAAQAEGT